MNEIINFMKTARGWVVPVFQFQISEYKYIKKFSLKVGGRHCCLLLFICRLHERMWLRFMQGKTNCVCIIKQLKKIVSGND